MGKEYPARSFKSGNSVAIRMPAALGVEPDREWLVEQVDGELRVRVKPSPEQRIDVASFWGKGPGLKPLEPEDRIIEERELDWTGARLKRDG